MNLFRTQRRRKCEAGFAAAPASSARLKILSLLCALPGLTTSAFALYYSPVLVFPPEPPQEFRGVWVATVNNTDWPSRRGLSTEHQKAELLAIFDRAVQLKLNAIIFQVRPQADALYASPFEPWSEYLTGTMGQAPWPPYDPLAFAVEEAHKRGLELHAWFNPYRALHPTHAGPVAANHISESRPDLVRSYGKYLWLDPGEREVQEYSLQIVMDVLKRYDIDGVHFDDYFYLSAKEAQAAPGQDFPDEASWKKFGAGGRLSRHDWRRANVDAFIERTYRMIKKTKPWVKFGVSPRGIWRSGFPPQIKGGDAFTESYADSRKWFVNGWVDYFSPQLYWEIEKPQTSFRALLNWWNAQGRGQRHLWPGLAAYRAKEWAPNEIVNQIEIARSFPWVRGHIFYNATNLMNNAALTNALVRNVYTQPAMVPLCSWLSSGETSAPTVRTTRRGPNLIVNWHLSAPVRGWVLQTRHAGRWNSHFFPTNQTSFTFFGQDWQMPDIITVRAIDRTGNLSTPTTVGKSFGSGIFVPGKASAPPRQGSAAEVVVVNPPPARSSPRSAATPSLRPVKQP